MKIPSPNWALLKGSALWKRALRAHVGRALGTCHAGGRRTEHAHEQRRFPFTKACLRGILLAGQWVFPTLEHPLKIMPRWCSPTACIHYSTVGLYLSRSVALGRSDRESRLLLFSAMSHS